MKISLGLELILKIAYVITSILIVIMPLTYAFPEILRVFPFYKNAIEAIDKLHKLEEEEEVQFGEKRRRQVKVGRVRKGEKGFAELVSAIKMKRKDLLQKKIEEIGLAQYGQHSALIFGTPPRVEPNAVIYIKEEGRNVWEPLIYHPTAPEITLELSELTEWVNDYAYRKLSFWTIAIVVIWGIILGFFVF